MIRRSLATKSASSLYAHLASVVVALGQRVDQGAMIATLGDGGRVSGSHLHFEEQGARTVLPAWFAGTPYVGGSNTLKNCVDVPLAGDFTGDPAAEVAVFRRARRSSFVVNQSTATPITVRFGRAFDEPLLGDWEGDGQTDVGVRTPRPSTFKLKMPTGLVRLRFGLPSDIPVSGDWDGNGTTEIGVRWAADGTFWPRLADGSTAPVWLGDADDLPVTGDWDGNGTTDFGVYDPVTATFTLRTLTPVGLPVLSNVQFGAPGDLPVTGDWDGNGVTDLGVWSPSTATFTQAISPLSTLARMATGFGAHDAVRQPAPLTTALRGTASFVLVGPVALDASDQTVLAGAGAVLLGAREPPRSRRALRSLTCWWCRPSSPSSPKSRPD